MILRWIVAVIVIYLLYRLIRRCFPAVDGKSRSEGINNPVVGEELVEDPFCHTYVPLSHAFQMKIDGKILYFCSQKCLDQYGKK